MSKETTQTSQSPKPHSKFSPRAQEDLELVRLATEQRDDQAYKKLMSKYHDSIYYMVLKMVHNKNDAEDVTLESFGKAFNNIHKYNPRYAFSTWLFKIATNNCIDFIRKKRLETVSLDQDFENDKGDSMAFDVETESLNPEERVIKSQRVLSVRKHVEKLDPKYRILIELRYYEEYADDEIAKELNLPLGTVKAQLFRAKEMLFKLIEKAQGKI